MVGGVCVVCGGGGRVWQPGSMHGSRGRAWQPGGMCGCHGGCAWDTTRYGQ